MQKHPLLARAFCEDSILFKISIRPIPHNWKIALRALNPQLMRPTCLWL
jgi:hypothetical protein